MSSVFIISLVTAFVAVYVYSNVSEDVPRLCAVGIALICFLLDLILAPWPIQLLILTLALIVPRKLMASN